MILFFAAVTYLLIGLLVSCYVKTEERIDSGWPVAVLFLGVLVNFVATVIGWPHAVITRIL